MPADRSVDEHGASRQRQSKHRSHARTFLPSRRHRGSHTPQARGQASKWKPGRRRSNTAGRDIKRVHPKKGSISEGHHHHMPLHPKKGPSEGRHGHMPVYPKTDKIHTARDTVNTFRQRPTRYPHRHGDFSKTLYAPTPPRAQDSPHAPRVRPSTRRLHPNATFRHRLDAWPKSPRGIRRT